MEQQRSRICIGLTALGAISLLVCALGRTSRKRVKECSLRNWELNLPENRCKMTVNGPGVKPGEGSIAEHKMRFPIALIVVVAVSVVVCPLAADGFGLGGASAQIAFTPHISALELTQTAEGIEIEAVATVGLPATAAFPTPPATPIMAPVQSGQYAICGMLRIGSATYPIGDPFSDASGIAVGTVVNADPFGRNGYAEIRDHPDYRLVWVTSEAGVRQYIIVHKYDPLFSDPNVGFASQVSVVRGGYQQLFAAGVPALSAAGTLITIGIIGCAPTAGGGCALAAGAAIVGGAVASAAEWWIRATVVNPALRNLRLEFDSIDSNRGLPGACISPQVR
jgi:hypothetical protein